MLNVGYGCVSQGITSFKKSFLLIAPKRHEPNVAARFQRAEWPDTLKTCRHIL